MTLRTAAILVVLLIIPGILNANTFEKGDRIHITNIHKIYDDFYGFGQYITIDGFIEGDLISGGYEISTSGKIGGSINVFANTYTHTGETKQSLRAFAETCRISGNVGRSILAMGSEVYIKQSADITDDADLFGGSVTVDGHIGRNLTVHGGRIYLSGVIDGDVYLVGDKITISAPTSIRGNLTYKSKNELNIELTGVNILGETEWVLPDADDTDADSGGISGFIVPISQMLAAFLFGIIMIYMFRRYALVSLQRIKKEFAKSFAVGILTLLIMTFSILILFVSIVGVIVGLILSSGSTAFFGSIILIVSILLTPITSFLALSGGILMYSGVIMAAILVGSLMLAKFRAGREPLAKLNLFLGLLIMTLLCSVPYLGFLVFLFAMLSGAGAIVLGVRDSRTETTTPSLPSDLPPPASPAPPPVPPLPNRPEN